MFRKKKCEVIAICFGNKLLAVREIENKKSTTIFQTILNVLNTNSIEPLIAVSDTEPTNTGHRNGVIIHLKREFPHLSYEPCRLHVLDLVLKHQIFFYFPCQTDSSNLPFTFVQELKDNWMKYKTLYAQQCVEIAIKYIVGLPLNEERRGDYKFLLLLVRALKQYRQTNQKPVIKNFPNSAPSISNARWNSRAIYALFAVT